MKSYSLVLAGSSFASTFFLYEFLKYADPKDRVLIIERGNNHQHSWHLDPVNRAKLNETAINSYQDKSKFRKYWVYNPSFGGGSNCWWGCTPRMHPNDFKTQSLYSRAKDWPISYQELEPYYYETEKIMSISGQELPILPRNKPFPQKPHNFNDVDRVLKENYPNLYTHQPTARARIATKKRSACCASGVCSNCPIDAKFTILNEFRELYKDPRVEIIFNAELIAVEKENNIVKSVKYRDLQGVEKSVKTDFTALGANAIFNPFILAKSGIEHKYLGRFLNEQASVDVSLDLSGLDNYQGSTSITGHGYMLYDHQHRSEYAGCLIENRNIPDIRTDEDRWTQRMQAKFIFEDEPDYNNYIQLDQERPILHFNGYSKWTKLGIDQLLKRNLSSLFSVLPIEKIRHGGLSKTEGHIQGTTLMGNDPKESLVDRNLIHHQIRNLAVLGSSTFPSCPAANPTLTISALSLKSARSVYA